MQIRRLRLSGFKSFVDPADLLIEPGLTGVVGPNGCGKSNVLEALRWTMGENSPKSMRGAGMDDVIFAGTATRPQRDFAEVSILADLDDGDEVEVVRRIERGAGSAYRINGRDVRARDVALLFADAATGAHSPALVSQNRIGAIIAAKPAERRQMLEEAAGIAGLHVRRRDAEQKLAATEANLARLGSVIGDQDARIAALRRQARQAERYRMLSDRIRVAEGRMIFARWRDAARAADTAKAEAQAADALVAERVAAHAAATARVEAAATALADARSLAQTMRDRATDAGHRRERLASERAGIERRMAELAATATRLADDRTREGVLAGDAADALARLDAEAKQLDTRIALLRAELPVLETALTDAERTARDADVAHAQALAAQASELAEARVAAAARDTATARRDRARRDAARLGAERAALADLAPLERQRADATERRAVHVAVAERAQSTLAHADAAERMAADERTRAQAALAAARATLAALDGEAAALTRAQRRGGGPRLIDALDVAPGYERALAAALGDDLESGVDPDSDRHWGGADTLPGDPSPPSNGVVLAMHVRAPDALARRLAQIIVVDEDTGQKLAVGQRLVTPEGTLRRWDGFRARAGAGAAAAERLERANRLRAIAAQRPDTAEAVIDSESALGIADRQIANARAAAADARRDLAAADAGQRAAARDEDRAAAAIERAEAQRTDMDARIARAAVEQAEAETEVEQTTADVAALPDGTAMRAQVAGLAATAERARAAVADARAHHHNAVQGIARDRDRHAAAIAEAKEWRTRAGDAARRIADIDRRAQAAVDERAALIDQPASLAGELAAVDATLATLRTDAASATQAEAAAGDALATAERAGRDIAEALAAARETRAGAAARAENQELRRVEMGRVSGERFECPPPLLPGRAGFDAADVATPTDEAAAHERLSAERERIGPVNLVAERELAELEAARTASEADRAELEEAVARLRGSIGTLNREGRARLLRAFEAVDGHFRTLFTTLFDGGQAHLAMIDSDDPLTAGLEIMAQPPGKRLQSLTLLSGGEQALTAVALVFALFLTAPAPICVLDEVDAPLDDANIERFCDLLDRMVRETATRYLIVTHNAATMARMHRLFGVTMVERGVSRLVSVDLGAAEAMVA